MSSMPLNAFAASQRLAIYDRLLAGLSPEVGSWDPELLRSAKVKGKPQMGTTTYAPDSIRFEFIYADPQSSATIFSVTVPVPERIVFLPVPRWVVETIWQGEIAGSHHFESDALALLEEMARLVEPVANREFFGPRQPSRRE